MHTVPCVSWIYHEVSNMTCSKCRAVPQWHMAEKCRILEKGQISRVAKYTYNGTCRKGPKGMYTVLEQTCCLEATEKCGGKQRWQTRPEGQWGGGGGVVKEFQMTLKSYSNLQWQKSAESPLQKHAPLTQESAGLALAFEYYTERSAKWHLQRSGTDWYSI